MSTPTEIPPESPARGNESSVDESKEASAAAALYSTCRHEILSNECGIPMTCKDETKKAIDALLQDERPPIAGVFGNGPLLISDVPVSSKIENAEVVLGIE